VLQFIFCRALQSARSIFSTVAGEGE
jgi:hypothetical protein